MLPWTFSLAAICARLITAFDAAVTAAAKVLCNSTTVFGVLIEAGYNGIEARTVLFAAIAAFPAGGLHKQLGPAAGFLAVQALNLVRVISLFYLGQ